MANLNLSVKSFYPVLMLVSIILGVAFGYYAGANALIIKPIGDIFLNLLFTAVVPLVFFSVSSAVASLDKSHQLLKMILTMFASFLFTGIIAAIWMLVIVIIYPPAQGVTIKLTAANPAATIDVATQLVNVFTVNDFSKLLSHQNMLPLICFSLLIGIAAAHVKSQSFTAFLNAGAAVFMKVISYVMLLAPLGFFAFFAVLVADLGPQIIQQYLRVTWIYYGAAILYFVACYTLFVYLANGYRGIQLFWRNVYVPMLTSLATCSSAASIPANLEATSKMEVPASIYETVIPVGAIVHKDGSVLGAIVKIAFLFGIYGMAFSSPGVIITAIFIALLVGTVMGAIPSGGMLGEMLILSFYGFPPESLLIIAAISIIIDPIATMLNVTGDSVAAMLVARFIR